MSVISLIGISAAACSVISFTPQAWKIIRTRETSDLSALMYALTVTGFGSWTIFGIILEQWPLVVSNIICFALSAFILAMILLPKSDREKVARTLDRDAR